MQKSRKPIEKVIGAVILNRRIELGYSQEQLASSADLHRTFLSDIERGARQNITLTTLFRLAKCLHVYPARLIEDAENYLDDSRPTKPKVKQANSLPKSKIPGSFAENYPELAAQWHTKLNARLKPHRILPDSKLEIWWQCPRNNTHSWQSQIGKRIDNATSCPICKT